MLVSKETAQEIAFAYREVETAEKLLSEIVDAVQRRRPPDIRDAFGRPAGLELGVPSGQGGHRIFNVPWPLAQVIIEAHIAQQKAIIAALSEKAKIEVSPAESA